MQHFAKSVIKGFFIVLIMISSVWVETVQADDKSCITVDPSTGQSIFEGVRCAHDANGNGVIDDCSEMPACSLPLTAGWCNKSINPEGYYCVSTGYYYFSTGFSAVGLTPGKVHYLNPQLVPEEVCMSDYYVDDQNISCPDRTCSPYYTYQCTKDSVVYGNAEICQNACGAQCFCDEGGVYNPDTKLCEVGGIEPCPQDFEYDFGIDMCIADFTCPEGTVLDPVLNKCVGTTELKCPPGYVYNSETGKCQKLPECPNGMLYNPDTDKCEFVKCPSSDYTFNFNTWRCERPFTCTWGDYIDASGKCEGPPGACIQIYANFSGYPDYIKAKWDSPGAGAGKNFYEKTCGPCPECYTDPAVIDEAGEYSFASIQGDLIPYPNYNYGPQYYTCLGFTLVQLDERDGICKYDRFNYYAKPYSCNFLLNKQYDKHTCDNICLCPADYVGDAGGCSKPACDPGETLDKQTLVCWANPITFGVGDCPWPYDFSQGRCSKAPYCDITDPQLTYDAESDRCEIYALICPGLYKPSGRQSICSAPPECPHSNPAMLYNPENDRCEVSSTFVCPDNYAASPSDPSVCVADPPPCHLLNPALIYNPETNRCEVQPNYVCSPPYTNSAVDQSLCVIDPPPCETISAGLHYNPNTDRCEATPRYECTSPYKLTTSNTCELAPCSELPGYTYEASSKTCVKTPQVICPAGYTASSPIGICSAVPRCPTGLRYDYQMNACVPADNALCADANYTYDRTLGICKSNPDCSVQGTYDPVMNKCSADGKVVCASPYVGEGNLCTYPISCPLYKEYYDYFNFIWLQSLSRNGRCEQVSPYQCEAGYTYDRNTGKCTSPVLCPSGTYWDINLKTCVISNPSSLITPCDTNDLSRATDDFTWDPNMRVCRGNYQCPSGSTWVDTCPQSPWESSGCIKTCIYDPSYFSTKCEAPYVWDDVYQKCKATPACPVGSSWTDTSPGTYDYYNQYYVRTCIMNNTNTTCETPYTWNSSMQACRSSFICPNGMNWIDTCPGMPNEYYACIKTCVGGTDNVLPCDPGYTFNTTKNVCQGNFICPQGSTFVDLSPSSEYDTGYSVKTCVINDPSAMGCAAGYIYDMKDEICKAPYSCPSPGVWVDTCPGSSSGNCIKTCVMPPNKSCTNGYAYNSATGRCELDPQTLCTTGTIFNPATDRCEVQSTANCPSPFVWRYPYCEKDPNCGTNTYSVTRNQCTYPSTTSCPSPYQTLSCISDQCAPVAACTPTYDPISITGGDLGYRIKTFSATGGGTKMTFTRESAGNITITFSGCIVSGSGDIYNAIRFSTNVNKINFYDAADTLLAAITVTGCTVSGSGAGNMSGPIGNGNYLDLFASDVVTFSALPRYICPLDSQLTCTGDPKTCTKTLACGKSCPGGGTLQGNTCEYPPDCNAILGGILNAVRDKCEIQNAAATCPTGYQMDAYGICYKAPVCPANGVLDPLTNKCYYTTCPSGYVNCGANSTCPFNGSNSTSCGTDALGNLLPCRNTGSYSGCFMINKPDCPPGPQTLSTDPSYCMEVINCPANFVKCTSNWCVYGGSADGCFYGFYYAYCPQKYIDSSILSSSQYANCYYSPTPSCPPSPQGLQRYQSYSYCYEKRGCTNNAVLCPNNANGYCTYSGPRPSATRYTEGYTGCFMDKKPDCPPAPTAYSLAYDYSFCYELTTCPTPGFKPCLPDRPCWFSGTRSYSFKQTYGYAGCYMEGNPPCPPAPLSNSITKDSAGSYCLASYACPNGTVQCSAGSYCNYRGTRPAPPCTYRWGWDPVTFQYSYSWICGYVTENYSGCFMDQTPPCPPSPSAVRDLNNVLQVSGDYSFCYEATACPANYTSCVPYLYCKYRSDLSPVYMQQGGCYGNQNIPYCPTGTNIIKYDLNSPFVCYKKGGCDISSGFQLETATGVCWKDPLQCPSGANAHVDYKINKCVSDPTSVTCPSGSYNYVWNGSPVNKCIGNPVCPNAATTGAVMDFTNDYCWTCPQGTKYDTSAGKCIGRDNICPSGGALVTDINGDPSRDECRVTGQIKCEPSQWAIYDAMAQVCRSTHVCALSGVVNASSMCVIPVKMICDPPTALDSTVPVCYYSGSICPGGGTLDTILDVCKKDAQIVCPVPSVPSTTLTGNDICMVDKNICPSKGALINDVCRVNATVVCPPPSTPLGLLCVYNADLCPLDGTLNAALDECEIIGEVRCPAFAMPDLTEGVCYTAYKCRQALSTQDTEPEPCPPGYALNTGTNVCGKILPVSFDTTNDVCWICPEGTEFDAALKKCVASPQCPPEAPLNTNTDVCETIAEIKCGGDTVYDVTLGKCVSSKICPDTVNCPKGCLNANSLQCDPAMSTPCPKVNTYNPVYDTCAVNGTPECPTDYTYNPANNKCEQSPPDECLPSDWVCPSDTDWICGENSPVTYKQYLEVSADQKYTFALTKAPVDYLTAIDTALSNDAVLASVEEREKLWNFYGVGPFWISGGALYADVFLNITACETEDFMHRRWRMKNSAISTCRLNEEHYEWERIENVCLCTQYETRTYTRSCVGDYFQETLTSSEIVNTDISRCVGEPVPTCLPGFAQPGIGDCSVNSEEFSGSLLCGTSTYPGTRKHKKCIQTKSADIPAEFRNVMPMMRGVLRWDYLKCTPCQSYKDTVEEDDPPTGPEVIPDNDATCADFSVFSGFDKRCRTKSLTLLFTDCCDLSGWVKSWCTDEERELKKRKIAKTCHEVGEYCAAKLKLVGICLKKKKSYCCFSSKLGRIINQQGRPQLGKTWGSAKDPDCSGLTPEELSGLDFSSMDLSEYEQDIVDQSKNINPADAETQAIKGMTEWMEKQKNP